MTAKEQAIGIYKAIENRYGSEFAKQMIDSIVWNVGNYNDSRIEERKELFEMLTAI